MNWWLDPEDYSYLEDSKKEEKKDTKELTWKQRYCYHKWKKTLLIVSIVYDCEKCGVKKEDCES